MAKMIKSFILGILFWTLVIFGFDRDMARRDYEKYYTQGNHEAIITGCIFKYNCFYYTKLLQD